MHIEGSYANCGAIHPLRLLLCCLVLAGFASAQSQQNQSEQLKDDVPDAIAKVKSGEFFAVNVDVIARANAVEAIPALKEQFTRVQESILKVKIAAALVRMGGKDPAYWNFLVQLITPAIESDAPDFIAYDSQGKSLPGPSPEFIAWAKSHTLSPKFGGEYSVAEEYVYIIPGEVGLLGWSRDPRAIPLLRQALRSPNRMVEIAAAQGLAEIGDSDSIPLIIEACKNAPADAAASIAESLVYFDDPEAQNAVDHFVPKNRATIYREARANGKKTPFTP